MRLPNSENAYISPVKLKSYLLSETHPIGRSKAKLLRSIGFNETNITLLKQELLSIAHSEEVKETISSPHGVKYIIEGKIQTPLKGHIKLRTVWIINKGQEHPHFVTAYPI